MDALLVALTCALNNEERSGSTINVGFLFFDLLIFFTSVTFLLPRTDTQETPRYILLSHQSYTLTVYRCYGSSYTFQASMSSFAAKMKLKAAKAAGKAKAAGMAAKQKAKDIDAKHNIVAKTKSGASSVGKSVSSAATKAKSKIDGAMSKEQQQQAMVGATLGLTAMSMVGVPGAGGVLTGMALASTASSLHEQQKTNGGKLSNQQLLSGAVNVGGAVGGAKTKMAMGAVNLGMQAKQAQEQGGGGGDNASIPNAFQQKMNQAKQAKKAMDMGKKLGIKPQDALKGAKMAKKAGIL